jgi:hypothetical protein
MIVTTLCEFITGRNDSAIDDVIGSLIRAGWPCAPPFDLLMPAIDTSVPSTQNTRTASRFFAHPNQVIRQAGSQ